MMQLKKLRGRDLKMKLQKMRVKFLSKKRMLPQNQLPLMQRRTLMMHNKKSMGRMILWRQLHRLKREAKLKHPLMEKIQPLSRARRSWMRRIYLSIDRQQPKWQLPKLKKEVKHRQPLMKKTLLLSRPLMDLDALGFHLDVVEQNDLKAPKLLK